MLVFTRRNHESVVVGSSRGPERTLKVTVFEIKPGSVKLGIETAHDVPVHRGEVWEQISADSLAAISDVPQVPAPVER